MEIKIKPTKKLFFNEESFYGIYGAEVEEIDEKRINMNRYGNISVKGNMHELTLNAWHTVVIEEEFDSSYKGTYIVEMIEEKKPVTVGEQRDFLKMVLTEQQINNIYEVYNDGQDIIGMIEDKTFNYESVHNLGEKSFEKLRKKILKNFGMSRVLAFLGKFDIPYAIVAKLVREYKSQDLVIQKVTNNPYVLTELDGIGFTKADEIAKKMGFDLRSPHRVRSCIVYIIEAENSNGHSWIGERQLLNKAIDLLNIEKAMIKDVLDREIKYVLKDNERYTLKNVYEAEEFVANQVMNFGKSNKKVFEDEELDSLLKEYCDKNNVELEENQHKFFHDWNNNRLLLLIGSGGMGKTYIQKILLDLVEMKNLSICLLSPTGRASKILSEHTKRPASTIHRQVQETKYSDGEITEDVIVVDEASMCDIFILQRLFDKISNHNARILFVGDASQLPSVSVANFLYDVINSKTVKVSELKKVFRQKDGGILNVATDMREGKSFLNNTDEGIIKFGKDCLFHLTEQQFISDGIIHYYKNVLKKYNQEDIAILSPTKKGNLGTVEINKRIQSVVNPKSNKREKAFGKKDPLTFRVGDLVMNTTNTYRMKTVNGGTADVFNGDTGTILDIVEDEKPYFVISFDGIVVQMNHKDVLKSLIHAWAMTNHKCQGGQFKVVIVIVDKSAKFQLNANLVYTGFSRAQEYMLVLGQAETINYAGKKFANMERRSFMQDFLKKDELQDESQLQQVQ